MRVINICHTDFANYGYHNAQAMKSAGIDADSFCLTPHTFYRQQAKRVSSVQMQQEIDRADIIQVMHSCGTMWDLVKNTSKRVIVWHTGTRYRQDPDKHNARWNDLAEKVVIALGEFQNLGAKNPIYFGITIDTNAISPDYSLDKRIRVAHYPSNAEVKGSYTISKIIEKLKQKHTFIYNTSHAIVPYPLQIRRMNQCDIYVEMCAPEQGGKPYGSYGTTAIEAAALGKVVVTNNLWQDLYLSEYGHCALEVSNSETDMAERLDHLLTMHTNDLIQKKVAARRWVEQNHSYEATGERMKLLLK